jgi:hypothetical protein
MSIVEEVKFWRWNQFSRAGIIWSSINWNWRRKKAEPGDGGVGSDVITTVI